MRGNELKRMRKKLNESTETEENTSMFLLSHPAVCTVGPYHHPTRGVYIMMTAVIVLS